jgi:hypothetical protein
MSLSHTSYFLQTSGYLEQSICKDRGRNSLDRLDTRIAREKYRVKVRDYLFTAAAHSGKVGGGLISTRITLE